MLKVTPMEGYFQAAMALVRSKYLYKDTDPLHSRNVSRGAAQLCVIFFVPTTMYLKSSGSLIVTLLLIADCSVFVQVLNSPNSFYVPISSE